MSASPMPPRNRPAPCVNFISEAKVARSPNCESSISGSFVIDWKRRVAVPNSASSSFSGTRVVPSR
jgi:hypothetical protein